MLAQKSENFCARTDICVPITIGLSSTCPIAKLETGAFYFTYNYTINESIRMQSIFVLEGTRVIRKTIALIRRVEDDPFGVAGGPITTQGGI